MLAAQAPCPGYLAVGRGNRLVPRVVVCPVWDSIGAVSGKISTSSQMAMAKEECERQGLFGDWPDPFA